MSGREGSSTWRSSPGDGVGVDDVGIDVDGGDDCDDGDYGDDGGLDDHDSGCNLEVVL